MHSEIALALTDYFEDGTISLSTKGVNNDNSHGNNAEINNDIELLSCLDLESQKKTTT